MASTFWHLNILRSRRVGFSTSPTVFMPTLRITTRGTLVLLRIVLGVLHVVSLTQWPIRRAAKNIEPVFISLRVRLSDVVFSNWHKEVPVVVISLEVI